MAGAEFHRLTVAEVASLTEDSVAIELSVPDELAADFEFLAGQHIVIRHEIDGHDVRRSYSLCVPAGSGRVQVAVRHLPGGLFSSFANHELRSGMSLQVTRPIGEFTFEPEAGRRAAYCAIAAGSGITPVISIVATVLEGEPQSEVTLIYGNRHGGSVMFLEELAELKDRYLDRLSLVHVMSRESSMIPLLEGRLDQSKIADLLDALVPVSSIARWFLCGPFGVVQAARAEVRSRGVDDVLIADELFFDERPPEAPRIVAGEEIGATVRFTLGGRTSEVVVDPDGAPILDYVLSVRSDAPFSCRSGACASCRAVVTRGEVAMHHNWCLTEDELAAGQVLSCQSRPTTDQVDISYDI